jgi:hypothetical protein
MYEIVLIMALVGAQKELPTQSPGSISAPAVALVSHEGFVRGQPVRNLIRSQPIRTVIRKQPVRRFIRSRPVRRLFRVCGS